VSRAVPGVRAAVAVLLAAGASTVTTNPAFASGPGAGTLVGGAGVVDRASGARYVALPAGPDTELAAIDASTGAVRRYALLHGRWGVPLVAPGVAGGLSSDGGTLVLAPAVPRAYGTRLLVLDPYAPRVRRIVGLPGTFSFDAVSPDGSLVYLLQYVSARDSTRYAVRVYDLAAGRLLRRIVADKRAWGTTMRGSPVARATSAGGRWAYTLYESPSGAPFVHALDTVAVHATCIDLPWSGSPADLRRLRLRLADAGRTLLVGAPGAPPLAAVDTRRLAVRAVATEAAASSSGPSAWWGVALLGVLPAGLLVRRRGVRPGPRRDPSDPPASPEAGRRDRRGRS